MKRLVLLFALLLIASPAWGEDFVRLYQDPGTFNPHLSLNDNKERYLSLDKLRAIDCTEIDRLKKENAELRARAEKCEIDRDEHWKRHPHSHIIWPEQPATEYYSEQRPGGPGEAPFSPGSDAEKLSKAAPKCRWEVKYLTAARTDDINNFLKDNSDWEPVNIRWMDPFEVTRSAYANPVDPYPKRHSVWLKRRVCE